MHWRSMKFAAAIGMLLVAQTSAGRTPAGSLQAGTARVEITPAADALPGPYSSILDPLYARAIYLENGQSRAVLLNADVGAIPTFLTDDVGVVMGSTLVFGLILVTTTLLLDLLYAFLDPRIRYE